MVDINQDNLKNIFYTQDRPLVWRYLDATLFDLNSEKKSLSIRVKITSLIMLIMFTTCQAESVSHYLSTSCILLSHHGNCSPFTCSLPLRY